ncbi:saccharopine dehydrogenase NADP-binding domain-containing protein [Spirillospora sp. NPDC047418]
MKVAILGCGSVASRVARSAAAFDGIGDLVVADIDPARARALGEAIGAGHARFDAADPESLAAVVAGADVVFNGVGPFYASPCRSSTRPSTRERTTSTSATNSTSPRL